jgi:hypothetical protein
VVNRTYASCAGEKVNEVGVLVTVKLPGLKALPAELLTPIWPLVAPKGTVARICVGELTVNEAADVPLKVTFVVPAKLVPVIVIWRPSQPVVGVKELIAGAAVTVKSLLLNELPAELVTPIFPVLAPEGTVARICVAESMKNVNAATPLKVTLVAPVKFDPVIVTSVATGPLAGVNRLIRGDAVTVKSATLTALPAELVTPIFPIVAPLGTVARTCVGKSTEKTEAAVPLNVTLLVPVKFVPVIVTSTPIGPLVGVNELIAGATITVKSAALNTLPAELVMPIFPVVTPDGTVARICVSESMVNVEAGVPLKVTPVVVE